MWPTTSDSSNKGSVSGTGVSYEKECNPLRIVLVTGMGRAVIMYSDFIDLECRLPIRGKH